MTATHGSFNTSPNGEKKKTDACNTSRTSVRPKTMKYRIFYSIHFMLWIAFCVKLFIVISVNAWGFAAFRPNKWPILLFVPDFLCCFGKWWIAACWMLCRSFIHWISTQFRMKYACRKTISGFDLFHSDICVGFYWNAFTYFIWWMTYCTIVNVNAFLLMEKKCI